MQTKIMNKTTSIFANKKDLEAAEKRIKELEAENRALKAGTASAPAAKASTAPPRTAPPAATVTWTPTPTPTLTRAGFNALTPSQKTEFFRDGGKLTNA